MQFMYIWDASWVDRAAAWSPTGEMNEMYGADTQSVQQRILGIFYLLRLP